MSQPDPPPDETRSRVGPPATPDSSETPARTGTRDEDDDQTAEATGDHAPGRSGSGYVPL
ncbi:MAG TPA: hypothetical protein VIL37_03025 [Natronosporangium sp.]